jgi:hypothetical protein
MALPDRPPGAAGAADLRQAAADLGLLKEMPAWLYFLCESKTREAGERIGATASHIIADTIVGLMKQNPVSVLSLDDGKWHPRDSELRGDSVDGLTTIRDFLLFAVEGTAQLPVG